MRLSDQVTLRPAPDRRSVPHCEICIAGRPTGLHVPGHVFEAAIDVGDGRFLVFVTEGVTMEELLSIHLVTADGRLVDTAAVGQIYSPGIFTALALRPPRTVTFRFLGEVTWSVEVLAAPRLSWPLGGDAPCVSRPFALRRAFRVRASAPG